MPWKIEYDYTSGDSEKHWRETRMLEFDWNDVDNAKKALKRIKEHYLWFDAVAGNSTANWKVSYGHCKAPEMPDWVPTKVLYPGTPNEQLFPEYYTVILALDNGNEVMFSAPWCGHFESLHSAHIIFVKDGKEQEIEDDMSFHT
jgi:hypothetical protein